MGVNEQPVASAQLSFVQRLPSSHDVIPASIHLPALPPPPQKSFAACDRPVHFEALQMTETPAGVHVDWLTEGRHSRHLSSPAVPFEPGVATQLAAVPQAGNVGSQPAMKQLSLPTVHLPVPSHERQLPEQS